MAKLSRATWRKSSYSSGSSGSACVEVAHLPGWRKSSYSTGSSGSNCVEVGDTGHAIALRDSKHPDGPSLLVSPTAWATFTSKIKSGHRPTASFGS
jgi:hypothetical protein